jgi:hypothetical protein
MIRSALVSAAALLVVSPLWAADQQIDRESLRLLDAVRVEVQDLPAGVPKEIATELSRELSKDVLVKTIEAKLAAAHVPLQRHGEYSVGDPFLRVTIDMTPENAGLAAYRVQVDFVQIVFMRRNPLITFNRAQTWAAASRLGLVPRAQLAGRVKEDLDTQLDQFIAAYKSVNSN